MVFFWLIKKDEYKRKEITMIVMIPPKHEILPLDRLPCPIMPKGHPNGFCDCPRSRIVFLGTCHCNGKCVVLATIPGATAEAVIHEDLHAY